MKEQIREEYIEQQLNLIGVHCWGDNFSESKRVEAINRHISRIIKFYETLLQEQKKEIIEGERLRIKSRVGSLRQWLNELPNDFIVSNDVIEHWLEISEQLKQEKQ